LWRLFVFLCIASVLQNGLTFLVWELLENISKYWEIKKRSRNVHCATNFHFLESCRWLLLNLLAFGGYPGSASLITDEKRWRNYINDSLIETSISKDILMLTRVDKPALLKRLFELGSHYSGQILSLTKIVGQLQDAGNTTTLTHYLTLLSDCGLLNHRSCPSVK